MKLFKYIMDEVIVVKNSRGNLYLFIFLNNKLFLYSLFFAF